ncbi:MAG: hypothetical protein ACYTKD_31105 [Planctomycetota bacterium]|jgi:hypothetical protein
MPTLESIKTKKKDLKDSQKLVKIIATDKSKHMKKGSEHHVGVELAEILVKQGRAKKA